MLAGWPVSTPPYVRYYGGGVDIQIKIPCGIKSIKVNGKHVDVPLKVDDPSEPIFFSNEDGFWDLAKCYFSNWPDTSETLMTISREDYRFPRKGIIAGSYLIEMDTKKETNTSEISNADPFVSPSDPHMQFTTAVDQKEWLNRKRRA